MDGGSFTNRILAEGCHISVGRNQKQCLRCSMSGWQGGSYSFRSYSIFRISRARNNRLVHFREQLFSVGLSEQLIGVFPENRNRISRGP